MVPVPVCEVMAFNMKRFLFTTTVVPTIFPSGARVPFVEILAVRTVYLLSLRRTCVTCIVAQMSW